MENRPIRYYSTNGNAGIYSFSEALLKGLAPDRGLFMPDRIPALPDSVIGSFRSKTYSEIATTVLHRFIYDEISMDQLMSLARDAYDFDVPVENVTGNRYILRLDQGPTASFKDFAARMMSRLMQFFLSGSHRRLTILTATSGDTGSAVASAFHGLENINVIILFPAGEVTSLQRRQMTTLKRNILTIAVDGKFDHCQEMVKMAFSDSDLSGKGLSSANSINIGRLLPQTVYYFHAWSQVAADSSEKVVFSVPSGNFGNLTAGLIARRMGLPVERFVTATNENNEVPEFLRTGIYKPVIPSLNCISSAMNVGHPSNLARIIDMYGGRMSEKGVMISEPDLALIRKDLFGTSVSDEETIDTIRDVYRKFNVLMEPHGAAAWKGLDDFLHGQPENKRLHGISLETAHPAKFQEEIHKILNIDIPLPSSLINLKDKDEEFVRIENNYNQLKDVILQHIK